ncbi:four-helix bundle copper-binding protein [Lichenibacterium dinghuense]|uniref:four-helix bundle copper-binding protein n=1 Tax=Lichenibacterium dinghuense TaxID=2895977 RepID=UPI001F188AA1|nr:four-helix bundle copper-binding protein [Lichenibacterium sp. 6Y81]
MDMFSAKAKSCIDACLDCYATCLGMASNHCLVVGGPHVEQEHFRLMLACAEVCRTHAHLMILGSPHARHLAPECAEIATRCAESCASVGDMEACVAACRACAASCSDMG